MSLLRDKKVFEISYRIDMIAYERLEQDDLGQIYYDKQADSYNNQSDRKDMMIKQGYIRKGQVAVAKDKCKYQSHSRMDRI